MNAKIISFLELGIILEYFQLIFKLFSAERYPKLYKVNILKNIALKMNGNLIMKMVFANLQPFSNHVKLLVGF